MRWSALLVALSLAAGCGGRGQLKVVDFSGPKLDPRPARPGERGHPGIVLRSKTREKIGRRLRSQSVTTVRSILIRDPRALALGNLVHALPSAARDIQVGGRTLVPDGRGGFAAHNIEKGLVQRLVWLVVGENPDAGEQVVLTAFPRVGVGSIIEISVSYRLPFSVMFGTYDELGSLPVREAIYELVYPQELVPQAWAPDFHRDARVDDLYRVLRFVREGYRPPPDDEAFASTSPAPRVRWAMERWDSGRFGGTIFAEWADVAEVGNEQIGPRLLPVPELQDAASRAEDPAAAMYRLVQDRVADDTTSWRQRTGRNSLEIWESRRGSADDRAVVLYAALRAAGVEAKLGAVQSEADSAGEGPRPPETLPPHPSMLWADHLLVVVPGAEGQRFLDPFCQRCAAYDLDVDHAGRRLFVFDPASKLVHPEVEWLRLPELALEGARVRSDLALTRDGIEIRRRTLTLDPVASRSLRHWLWTRPRDPGATAERLRAELDAPLGGKVVIEGLEAPRAPLTVTFSGGRLRGGSYAVGEDTATLSVGRLGFTRWMRELLASRADRATDVDLGLEGTYRWTARVAGPPGYRLATAPPSFEVMMKGVYYRREVRPEGDAVVVEAEARTRPRWAAKEARRLQDFVRAVRKASDDEIVWSTTASIVR